MGIFLLLVFLYISWFVFDGLVLGKTTETEQKFAALFVEVFAFLFLLVPAYLSSKLIPLNVKQKASMLTVRNVIRIECIDLKKAKILKYKDSEFALIFSFSYGFILITKEDLNVSNLFDYFF